MSLGECTDSHATFDATDDLSPDDLLALLSPAQREAFDTTLRDPTLLSALVDAEFQAEPPWWEPSPAAGTSDSVEVVSEQPEIVQEGLMPALKVGEDGRATVSQKLIYNILAVL